LSDKRLPQHEQLTTKTTASALPLSGGARLLLAALLPSVAKVKAMRRVQALIDGASLLSDSLSNRRVVLMRNVAQMVDGC
jgi:hypothetical protein